MDVTNKMKKANKGGTSTSVYGVSKRENHDSSLFYSRKLFINQTINKNPVFEENRISDDILDTVHCGDSRDLSFIPDNSVHLMVTSPPYNCGKEYDENLDIFEYRKLLIEVFEQVYMKLVVGGRACINVANLGRSPYIPIHSYLIHDMIKMGFIMRGEIIWQKKYSQKPLKDIWSLLMTLNFPQITIL